MNTTQLECFMAVANYLNFSRAAGQLQITQPAVSHQISTLEDELGVKLFLRTSKSVRLTRAGMMYVHYAQELLKLSALSRARVQEFQESLSVRLGIGCRNFLELKLLTPLLERLHQSMPMLVPAVRLVPFASLDNLLEEEDVQVIFTFRTVRRRRPIIGNFSNVRSCVPAPGRIFWPKDCPDNKRPAKCRADGDLPENGLSGAFFTASGPFNVRTAGGGIIFVRPDGGCSDACCFWLCLCHFAGYSRDAYRRPLLYSGGKYAGIFLWRCLFKKLADTVA